MRVIYIFLCFLFVFYPPRTWATDSCDPVVHFRSQLKAALSYPLPVDAKYSVKQIYNLEKLKVYAGYAEDGKNLICGSSGCALFIFEEKNCLFKDIGEFYGVNLPIKINHYSKYKYPYLSFYNFGGGLDEPIEKFIYYNNEVYKIGEGDIKNSGKILISKKNLKYFSK